MLTAVVLTKNEEKNIAECIKSLLWCKEIVVIDDYSKDQTLEIAQKHAARIFQRSLGQDFASQRNFGLEKAKGDWVLFLDADERITPLLKQEIIRATENPRTPYQGFRLKRKTVMWGRQLKSRFERESPIRLARKDSGKWRRRVHETWDIKGGVLTLKNPLLHYTHQTLAEFLRDIDLYSTLHARVLYEEGKSSNLFRIVIWPIGKFLEVWIKERAFKDGTMGFVISGMMGLHSFLAWGKLWLLRNKQK